MSEVPAAFVQRIREAAFLVGDPKLQLGTLTSIPGIGLATATVVLAFYDPTNYAVGDRYMMQLSLVRTEHCGSLTTRNSSLHSLTFTVTERMQSKATR